MTPLDLLIDLYVPITHDTVIIIIIGTNDRFGGNVATTGCSDS